MVVCWVEWMVDRSAMPSGFQMVARLVAEMVDLLVCEWVGPMAEKLVDRLVDWLVGKMD